jgi:hypothetical protein
MIRETYRAESIALERVIAHFINGVSGQTLVNAQPDISKNVGPVKSFLSAPRHSLLRVVLFVFFTLCIDDHGSLVI